MKAELRKVAFNFDMSPHIAEHLMTLKDFKIVILVDNSGSMNTPINGTNMSRTRWNELREFLPMVIKIAVIFNPNGVDIYFLNGEPLLGVTDPSQLDERFSHDPKGHTPLAKVFEQVLRLPEA